MVGIEDWMDYLTSRGRKELTIKTYRLQLGKCMRTLEQDGRSTDPKDITIDDVFFLKTNLGICENSAKMYLETLGKYTKFSAGEDITKKADILWNSVEPDRLFIKDGDLERLLEVATLRETVIILLGACMGLRRAEIVSVKWSDIKDGRLTVHGKGHGEGKVVSMKIPERVLAALNEWKREETARGYKDRSEGCIVPAIQRGELVPMVPTSLSHIMKDIGDRASVRVTAHSLRRNFATNLYTRHVDVVDIKELMRHESIDTTVRCYIQADKNRLDSILENF